MFQDHRLRGRVSRDPLWRQVTNLVDLEFQARATMKPGIGRAHPQERIDAVPEGKFDALPLGYALQQYGRWPGGHTPLVIPAPTTPPPSSRQQGALRASSASARAPNTTLRLLSTERGGERVPWQQGAQLGDTAFGYQELGEATARRTLATSWKRSASGFATTPTAR